jgi:DNA polymerase elongation subunit (family B)
MQMQGLVFNIETIADPNLPDVLMPSEDDVKVGNTKDPEKVRAMKMEKLKKLNGKLSLSPLTGIPICMGYLVFATDGFMVPEIVWGEEAIISRYQTLWRDKELGYIVTFNGKAFDLPYLAITFARWGVPFPTPPNVYARRYENAYHCDLFQDLGEEGSLKDWSARFGIDPPPGDGSLVQDLWNMGDKDSIAQHCIGNVRATYALYRKLQESWGFIY